MGGKQNQESVLQQHRTSKLCGVQGLQHVKQIKSLLLLVCKRRPCKHPLYCLVVQQQQTDAIAEIQYSQQSMEKFYSSIKKVGDREDKTACNQQKLERWHSYLIQVPFVETKATAGLRNLLVMLGNLSKNLGSITSQKSCSRSRSLQLRSRSNMSSWKCSSSSSMNFAFATTK